MLGAGCGTKHSSCVHGAYSPSVVSSCPTHGVKDFSDVAPGDRQAHTLHQYSSWGVGLGLACGAGIASVFVVT